MPRILRRHCHLVKDMAKKISLLLFLLEAQMCTNFSVLNISLDIWQCSGTPRGGPGGPGNPPKIGFVKRKENWIIFFK